MESGMCSQRDRPDRVAVIRPFERKEPRVADAARPAGEFHDNFSATSSAVEPSSEKKTLVSRGALTRRAPDSPARP
jgi:hypothetical protein